MIKLLGILVIAVGFALRWNALAVVLVAGFLSGLLAGIPLRELVAMTGQFFVDNRTLILPLLLLVPVVGVLERHGLRERVAALMQRARGASAGGVLWIYQVVRGVTSTAGLSIGNHASMVRPLIAPMAESAAAGDARGLAPGVRAAVRAHAAASENVGNFFADDILVAVGALLFIRGFFESAGHPVALENLQKWSIPTALFVIAVGWWRSRRLNARLARLARLAHEERE